MTKADEKAFEWCISHFLALDDEDPEPNKDIRPIDRPTEKLRPLDIKDMLVPPNLITETEILGSLPPEVEKYRGLWISPTIDTPPLSAIFVERLTPTEMTIAKVRKNSPTNHDDPRFKLKWDGQIFREVGGEIGHSIVVSRDGEAMLLITEYAWEAMPTGCFISAKHY